ncbi:hypothetical protein COU57_02325 [Candidatus Pacearchaeota archaeon CG10_big_fil_rev_8_21_14_0_10_32_14]|nr:MAG: hypothetical protein COU57_02325 [Candidatus Pacearchaeota archaeon CG10_big_fil_rev_8_21_14_0_10_32_14]
MEKKKTLFNKNLKKKNPWIAAFLNIIPGLGYLYLSKRIIFAILLLFVDIVFQIDLMYNPSQDVSFPPLLIASLVLFIIGFMYDAYFETKKLNGDKTTKNLKKKNPWIAAFLNIISGLGYLYLGKRKVFAILLLASIIVYNIALFFTPSIQISPKTPLFWIGSLIYFIAFIYDAYKEAKE